MTAHHTDPPLWQFVYVTLSTGTAILCQWDGNQWWTDSELPISNNHVINWRVVN
jgi:hypothetical protein